MSEMLQEHLVKKVVHISMFSGKGVVVRGAGTFSDPVYEKFYRLNSKVDILSNPGHSDIFGLRSLYPIRNIQKLQSLKSLDMPYALCPINNDEQSQ